ncbi:MAG TPA: hypothetical protein PKM73_12075 [Verrucomicrobiota bacterium]|nr:hypothetical protein [Verrucomicrobiota bacterium]HNU50228.1 hypothetical protein [Verrucomicrobiota bacterium]
MNVLIPLGMVLTLINATFLNLSCKALTAAYPASLLKLGSGSGILKTFTAPGGVLMGRIGGIAARTFLREHARRGAGVSGSAGPGE